MYWLRNTVVPNIAMPTATLAITASTTVRSREQAQRDQRLRRAALDDDRGGRAARRRAPTSDGGLPREPVVLLAGQRDPDQQARDAAGDQDDAGVVDLDLAAAARQVQRALQDDERGDRERHADVEAPAPAEAVGDDAADQRAGDGADAEHGAEVAGVAAALARGDEVGEDRPARAR